MQKRMEIIWDAQWSSQGLTISFLSVHQQGLVDGCLPSEFVMAMEVVIQEMQRLANHFLEKRGIGS